MDEDTNHHATSNPSSSFQSNSETVSANVTPCEHLIKDPSSDKPPKPDVVRTVQTPIPTRPNPQIVSIRTVVYEGQKDDLQDLFKDIIHRKDAAALAAQRRRTDRPLPVSTSVEATNPSLIPKSAIKPSPPLVRHRSRQYHPTQAPSDPTMDNQDRAASQPRHDDSIQSEHTSTARKFQITLEQMQMIPLFRGDINEDGNEWILNANKAFCAWGWEENNMLKCNYIRHCLRDRALVNYQKLFDDETKKNWEAFVVHWRAVYPPSTPTATQTANPMAAFLEFHKLRLDPRRLSEKVHTDDGKVNWEVHDFARKLLQVGANVSCVSSLGRGMMAYLWLPSNVREELPIYDPRTEPTLQRLCKDLASLDCTRFADKSKEKESRITVNWQWLWTRATLFCTNVLAVVAGIFIFVFLMRDL